MFPAFLLAVLLLVLDLACAADLYKILDIHKSASEKDIRHAYKKLSRKYHPDKNTEPGAKTTVGVLNLPQKRDIYDRHGEEGLKAHESGQHHSNPFDVFSNFFGGGHQQQQTRRGPSSLTEFEVECPTCAYKGASIDFMIKKNILCDHCRGSGAASDGDIHSCSGCGGSGIKMVKQQHEDFPWMFAQSQTTCNECGGRGKIIAKKCPHCSGNKVVEHTGHYTLEITPGMPEGHEVVFEGESDESPDWEAGDVVLRVRSRKHKGGWRRKESSLYWRETIGVDEALLGFDRNLTHLDGHVVRLQRKGVTQPGMPHFEKPTFGDLFVEYNVVLPIEISPQTRRKLAEAFHAGGSGHDEL
ncbi:DnaJ-domain-containing protein [Mycena galopus ATCC 62051]|nr:DnaJ-domain-containing protein [Mycena galopus ATCC 62051]